jgi:hypothetical protein
MSHTMTFSVDETEVLTAAAECTVIGLPALCEQLPHIDRELIEQIAGRLARAGLVTVSQGARTPAIAVTNYGRRTLGEMGRG